MTTRESPLHQANRGYVSIVGAGPGDPELLTVRAVDRLQRADLILYDALLSQTLLQLAPRARRLYVGKRAGRKSIAQATIERLLIRAARRGERVVRLKGGDPFVLGRGGEEALALAAAGVPFEVVPGISSSIAAASSAGIPVTHRGLTTGFVVVSGHSEQAYRDVLEGVRPSSATLVVLMGLRQRAALTELLLARGWPADTPTALILGATTGDAASWKGSLAELPQVDPQTLAADAPGTIVIGDVVRLAQALQQDRGPERANESDSGQREAIAQ
jgi:uroporphyrin-III C-methyltransferase/precorrin-2 dehydrogenase/sirohydrochlorin ferrochelatase